MKGFKRKQQKPAKKGQSNQQSTVGDMRKSHDLPVKKMLIVLVAIVALGALGWLGYKYYQDHSRGTKVKPTTTCSKDTSSNRITVQASLYFKPSDAAKLQPIVAKIQTMDGYDKDPNCLYPIIKYFVNTNEPAKAKENYDKLVLVFGKKSKFSSDYGTGPTLETIKEQVESAQQFQEKLKANTMYFN